MLIVSLPHNRMHIVDKLKSVFSSYIVIIVLILIAAIIGITYGIVYLFKISRSMSNSDNITRIAQSQNNILLEQYSFIFNNSQAASKIWSGIADKERLLINMNMTGIRLGGYLGPFKDGVFSTDEAINTGLRTGARVLFIDIEYNKKTSKPELVYRDSEGYIRSLNTATVKQVAKSISERAFSVYSDSVPVNIRDLPLIVVLYFHSTPDIVKKPVEYITFLSDVSKELQVIQPYILGQTPQGDFRRQNMDTQLFFQPMSVFKNKIILLCNVDTTLLRKPSDYGAPDFGPTGDLDLLVNARIYSQESGTSFGASSVVRGTTPPAAIITKPEYFLKMPPENRAEAILLTKKCFTITMNPDDSVVTNVEDLNSLITDYGVNCVPFVHFMDMKSLTPYFAIGNLYEKTSVLAKSQQLRFVIPDPIITKVPTKAMNTNGGFITLSNV